MRVSLSRVVPAQRDEVWAALSDLASHAAWMADAVSVEFDTAQRRGVGTRYRVDTRVGPIRTIDVIEVTEWSEGESISIAHRGLVSGAGTFTLTPLGHATEVHLVEELAFPWWLGGRLGQTIAQPILTGIWKRNLIRLEEAITAP